MRLIQDLKDLKWPGRMAVTLAAIVGLASAGYGAHILKGQKPLEEQVAVEQTYKPGRNEEGKFTYTFKTNDNQREGYTVSFSTETAFKKFNDFVKNYTADHEQELNGRDYLTPAEAWQLVKVITNKPYTAGGREITNADIDNVAVFNYNVKKYAFKITFDKSVSRKPVEKFDLESAAGEEYNKLEADQDRYLKALREKITARQIIVNNLWNAAEAHYQRGMSADATYQRGKAEFSHYKR
jgi:hypothetical protein